MPDLQSLDVAVIGGGAAGFFAALSCAEVQPTARIAIFERSADVLAKVRISGGGRCNVTHACFDPDVLVKAYPRGAAELIGPFHRFQPSDTVEWFESRGVALKTESDGRMFPVSDKSETIIQCLTQEATRLGVKVESGAALRNVVRRPEGPGYFLYFESGDRVAAERVILATGSGALGWEWSQSLGHTVVPPVPSLFTFSIQDPRLEGLSGVSVSDAEVRLEPMGFRQRGPVLITHWGLSGPAVLKLSAWGARALQASRYHATVRINWLPNLPEQKLMQQLSALRSTQLQKVAPGKNRWGLPDRLWTRLAVAAGIAKAPRWTEVSNEKLRALRKELQEGAFRMTGKSPFKEEFVTCGGVQLNEVDFRTMESRRCPGLYFAGEVLDVDAITGGFNFQNAWTTGWIAGRSAAGAGVHA